MATVSEQIQEVYIGLLGRAADKAGLDYWAAELEAGTITIEQVRANIVENQAEYAEGLGSMTRVQTVAELYQRLFEREAAANELEYWVNEEGGAVSVDELVLALSNGASAADRLTLDNKTTAASYYTNNTASYDADSAKAAVDSVDGTQASVEASQAATNAGEPAAETAYELTAGTDKGTDFVGTSAADTFTADLSQNAFAGGVSNTLSSADKLDGQGGIDTLKAQIVNEFVGVTGAGYQVDIQPTTTNIEIVELEARDIANGATGNGIVTLDAKDMTDITKIGSSFSDADLVIENLTTLTNTGNLADARNTEELTIVMDHTDNVNSDGDASDLTVYFDEDYLISGKIGASSSIDYRVFNQDAYDLIEEGKQDVELLDGVTFERLNFELDGQTYELAPMIGSDDDATGTAIRTHEQLVDAMNSAIAELGLTDKVTAVIGGTFTEETAQGATGSSRTAPIVRLEGVEGVELTANENLVYLAPSDQNPTSTDGTLVQNSNRYDRAEVSSTEEQNKPVTINVELEKVGRDGEGGFLVIGGKDQNTLTDTETDQVDGIAVFNIDVNGTNDQPSNLNFISSTDQALTTVNIEDGATWGGADLVIRNSFNGNQTADGNRSNWSNDTNVETVNANSFSGDLTIGTLEADGDIVLGTIDANGNIIDASAMMNVNTFTATGGGVINVAASIDGTEKDNFSYTTGSAADTLTIYLDGDAVDQTGTGFTASTGAGSDKVTVTMETEDLDNAPDVSFQTTAELDNNLTINAGSGDDSVILNAYGTFDINAGEGSDFVRIDSTDENGNAATGTWTFGDNTGAQTFGNRVLFEATLQVSFAGFEETVTIPTDANGNYIANQLTINEAIKSAIAANPELKRLLSVEDNTATATAVGVGGASSDISSTGTQELVITSTVGGRNDLSVTINQKPLLTVNELASADLTALRQGIIDTTTIDSDELGDAAAIINAMDQSAFGNNGAGVFAGNVGANGVVGSDYEAVNTGGTTDDTTAINFSTINMGTGSNDLVVLHSNDNSANILEVTGTFGKVSVVNFFDNTDSDVAGDGDLTVGNHELDFTSILDNRVDVSIGNSNTQSAVAIANSVNTDATAEANSVSVLNFTADASNANAVDWDGLNASNLVAALNGDAGATILGTGTIDADELSAADSTAGGDLIGSTHKHVVMVHNENNDGEYKVFSLTSDSDSANFNNDGVLLGTLDFGYNIGTDFKLVGSAASTASALATAADALAKNGSLTVDGVEITDFDADITNGTVTNPDPTPDPTYSLAADVASVDEGSSVTFTLTTDAADGSYDYTIGGDVNPGDIAGGVTEGTMTVTDGVATLNVALNADGSTEGAEVLTLTVAGQTANVTVNDTSVDDGPGNEVAVEIAAEGTGQGTPAELIATDANDVFTVTLAGEQTGIVSNELSITGFASGDSVNLSAVGIDPSGLAAVDPLLANVPADVSINDGNLDVTYLDGDSLGEMDTWSLSFKAVDQSIIDAVEGAADADAAITAVAAEWGADWLVI